MKITDLEEVILKMFKLIIEEISNFIKEGSGWSFNGVLFLI